MLLLGSMFSCQRNDLDCEKEEHSPEEHYPPFPALCTCDPTKEQPIRYFDWSLPLKSRRSIVTYLQQLDENCDAPLRGKFSVLNDWATALHECHANGIVHGNLTPESLVVDTTCRIGILLEPSDHVSPCQWRGPSLDNDFHSARWAATELFRTGDVDPRPTTMSDVYSFGCLMLQTLTGSVPYCGTKRLEQVVYLKYLGREPIDAQTPKVADRYVTFMRQCWSLDPEKRPSMGTVVDFIRDEMKRLGGQRG